LNLRPLDPQSEDDSPQLLEFTAVANCASNVSPSVSPGERKQTPETTPPQAGTEAAELDFAAAPSDDFQSALLAIMALPLDDTEKAEAVRRLLAAPSRPSERSTQGEGTCPISSES